jgi:hypothetical protein
MQIADSTVLLTSQHESILQHTRKESLRLWVGGNRPLQPQDRSTPNPVRPGLPRDTLVLSDQARAAARPTSNGPICWKKQLEEGAEASMDPEMRMLILLFEKMTGQKIRIFSLDEGTEKDKAAPAAHTPQSPAENQARGWGMEYDYLERLFEAEQTVFSASGIVKTRDGREIRFQLDLRMERSFLQENQVSLRMGDAVVDPLVINFDGNAAQLTERKFLFDLNADGTREEISFVAPHSGFLVLDKNGDGIVNDGSELFGPTTGNGFTELSAYDQDGNRWIDGADAVFGDLHIWTRDAQGKDHLRSLAQLGIGALYLEPVATPFSHKDRDNALLGQVRSSTIYLHEDGSVGSVQQLDLAI